MPGLRNLNIIDPEPYHVPVITITKSAFLKYKKIEEPNLSDDILEEIIHQWVDHKHSGHRNKQELAFTVSSQFKQPGEYGFNEVLQIIRLPVITFLKYGTYCPFPEGTFEYITFWEKEKEKCIKGLFLYDQINNKEWYIPGDYYMWLNYLIIYNKEKKGFTFPDIRDVQYHMAMYVNLAELMDKHSAIVKKRQVASSYYHCARLINKLWFFEGAKLKLLAYNEIPHLQTTWQYLSEYRSTLNTNTAWYRPMKPDTIYHWIQQTEINEGGKKKYTGLKSEIKARPMSDDPTGGVGGATSYVFYEEAGLSPNMEETFRFMEPAMKEGEIITGQFMAAGTVGDMDQSKCLRKFIYDYESYNVLGVDNAFVSPEGITKTTGLFVPQQWGMKPFIDEYGNSMVQNAMDYLLQRRSELKQKMDYRQYHIMVSQEPIYLDEAFTIVKESRFPITLIKKQIDAIQDESNNPNNPYQYEVVRLERKENGTIEVEKSDDRPVDVFPTPKDYPNKKGAIQVWERPIPGAPAGTYFASIDPVAQGKTITSNSLACIQVFRNITENTYHENEGETFTNQIHYGGLVCTWTGRFEELDKTNDQMLKIAEWYNAQMIVESNVSNFIQYVISKKKQHMLIRSNQFMFLREMNSRAFSAYDYGWKNAGSIFDDHIVEYAIKYINQILYTETIDEKSGIYRNVYGITRIKDKMLLQEMLLYGNDYNSDRLIAFAACAAFMEIYNNNRKQYVKIKNKEEHKPTKQPLTLRYGYRNTTPWKRLPFSRLR